MQIPVEVVISYSKHEARLCGSVTEEPILNKARKQQQLVDCEVRKHIAKYTQAHPSVVTSQMTTQVWHA